jgi:hypothetical protein
MESPHQGALPEEEDQLPRRTVHPETTEVRAAELGVELAGEGAHERGVPAKRHGSR